MQLIADDFQPPPRKIYTGTDGMVVPLGIVNAAVETQSISLSAGHVHPVNITLMVLQMGEPDYWESLRKRTLESPITPEFSSPRVPSEIRRILVSNTVQKAFAHTPRDLTSTKLVLRVEGGKASSIKGSKTDRLAN